MKPHFAPSGKKDFYTVAKLRANEYFQQGSKHANAVMFFKTALLLTTYVTCYLAIMSNAYQGVSLLLWYMALGATMSLLGLNFSHDVMHGAFFASPKWNRIWSYFFDLNGTSSHIWKISHNVFHHTYTNIPGHDHDIDKGIILRLSPKDKVYPFHAYQHFYAPFLYLFTSLNWAVYSDFQWFLKFYKQTTRQEILLFLTFKVLYFLLFLILPAVLLSAPAWQVLLGFVLLHFIGGFASALVFQLAHVVENVQFPTCHAGKIDDCWVLHELKTTSNFAPSSKFWGHLVGGLNCQIEHHLFPGTCHVHYPALSVLVKQTAQEFGYPYIEQPGFFSAVRSHFRTLERFGKE